MILKCNDIFAIHRCIYCRGTGIEDMFALSGRWDDNLELDPKNIVGKTVTVEDRQFVVMFNDSGSKIFMLVSREIAKEIKSDREI